MLFRKTAVVYCETHTIYIDTRCRQNVYGFYILITVLITITFFLDMRQSHLVQRYQNFKEVYCLQIQGVNTLLQNIFCTTLNMERVL
jgi:hypothetical protein